VNGASAVIRCAVSKKDFGSVFGSVLQNTANFSSILHLLH